MSWIVAVDPGKMTGIAVYDSTTAEHRAFELPYDAGTSDLPAMSWVAQAAGAKLVADLVSESIIISKNTAKKSQDVLASVEQIGIMRYLCSAFEVPFSLQSPSERAFCTDRKLHALGWWTKGPHDHPREATRHLVTRLCKVDSAFRDELAVRLR